MFKKLIATAAALLLGAGLSVIAVAAPAAAHHTDITGTAACAPEGGWNITWTVVNSENRTAQVIESNRPAVVPVGTPFAKNPGYNTANSIKNTFTEHVWSNVSQTLTLKTQWSNGAQDTKSGKVTSFPSNCGTPADTVTCTAATAYTGEALTNGDHINMEIKQDGVSFQINTYVDIRQAQDPASESGLVARISKTVGDQQVMLAVLPITNAQKNSGTLVFEYAKYLTGKWVVTWVQYDSADKHFTDQLKCGTDVQDAAASVTLTPATCEAPGFLTLNPPTWADWGNYTPAVGPYSVVATAKFGHTFAPDATPGVVVSADGKTKTFTGTVEAQKTGPECVTEPPCITDDAVTYWYSPATNSGWIDVAKVDGSTGVLCEPFWVTATTWKFIKGDSVWPQKLDQKQDLYIDKTGHYEYGINVECGQGDIYASFDAQPAPTPYLYGPDNPFDEHFLHQMGFTGPAPTYTQDKPGCNIVTPVAPTAKPITECGVYGSVLAEDTAEIDYTITGSGNQGIYTVTAAAKEPFAFAADAITEWTFDLGTYVDCVDPKVDFRLGVCTPNGEEPNRFSTKDLFITLDNLASDGPVTFTVVGAKDVAGADPTADIVRTVPAGESIEVETAPVTDDGTEYVVTFAAPGSSIPNQTITVPAFEGCLDGQPGDPTHTNQQCLYGEITDGSITVLPLTGFEYTIDGPDGLHLENVGETTTGLKAGTYQVTVKALPGYVLTGPEKWPYEIVIEEPEHCEELTVPAVLTSAILCDADGSYSLPASDGYDWYLGDAPIADGVHTVESAASFVVTARVVDSSYGFPGGEQQVEFPLTFTDPVDCVVFDAAAELTVKPATCVADGSIDPATLVLENATWDAPLPTAPGNHTVTAIATAGHAFPGGATSKVFEIVIPAMLPASDPTCQLPDLAIVTPTYSMTPLTCTAAGSFTLGAVEPGTINWSIDGGEPTTGGTFPVTSAKTVSLVATPVNPEDGLDESWTYTEENPLVLTFAAGTANCDLATLAFTGVGPATQIGLLGALLALAGFGTYLVGRRVRAQR